MTALPATQDIVIRLGVTFRLDINVDDSNGDALDVSAYTGAMQVRASRDSATVLATGTVTTSSTGLVRVEISSATTGGYDWTSGVYDVIITDASNVSTCIVEGYASTLQPVTQ